MNTRSLDSPVATPLCTSCCPKYSARSSSSPRVCYEACDLRGDRDLRDFSSVCSGDGGRSDIPSCPFRLHAVGDLLALTGQHSSGSTRDVVVALASLAPGPSVSWMARVGWDRHARRGAAHLGSQLKSTGANEDA